MQCFAATALESVIVIDFPFGESQAPRIGKYRLIMMNGLQANSGGVRSAVPVGIEPPSHCVYLLVCADNGPRAGLFKLGLSSRFEGRHREHARNWEEFDLARSALVRARSRDEARHLENCLRWFFSSPEADAKARATKQQLSSEEFIALGSHRRNPGQRKEGYTEFFAAECMEEMLELAPRLQAYNGNTVTEDCVQRDLTLLLATGGTLLPRQTCSQAQRLALANIHLEQKRAVETARAAAIAGVALDLAQAYDEHLVWVCLDLWRANLADPDMCESCPYQGWADLYFGRFGPPRSQPRMRLANEPPPTPAETRFVEMYCGLKAAAGLEETNGSRRWQEQSCWLIDAVHSTRRTASNAKRTVASGPFPHPVCADTLVLRLNFGWCECADPFFARFEALARRTEGRHRWEQPQLFVEDQAVVGLKQSDRALLAT